MNKSPNARMRTVLIILAMILLVIPFALADNMILINSGDENIGDQEVRSGEATSNFGGTDNLVLQGDASSFRRTYITWNNNYSAAHVGIIKDANVWLWVFGADVTATVYLFCMNASANVGELIDSWDTQKGGVAMDNAENMNLNNVSLVVDGAASGYTRMPNATACLQLAQDKDWANVTTVYVTSEPTVGNFWNMRSKEYVTVENHPILNVTFDEPADVTAPTVTVSSPSNNTALNQNFINFTVTATDTSGNIICHLRNETTILDEDNPTSAVAFNLTFGPNKAEIQQNNMYNITCFDNDAANNNSAHVLLNITLDNVIPTITSTLPANNTVFDKTFNNLTIDVSCLDRNAIAFNYSLIDSSGNVINSIQNNTAAAELIIKNTTDLSDIPTGNYNINLTCVDGHTYSDSKIDSYFKDEILSKVYYYTSSGNDISIQMYSSSIPLCDFGSRSEFDREVFWYDFDSCNPDAKGINTYRFTLRDNDNNLRYLKNSNYKVHFITKENFITFQLDETAGYAVTKVGKNYNIIVTTAEKFLDFDNSIGGLNKNQIFLNLSVIQSNFSSIEHFDIEIADIILDSPTFVTVSSIKFNLSQDRRLTMKNSLVLTKFSNPQSTEVTGRIILNKVVLLERSVSTVADLDTTRSINFIIENVQGMAGENNLTYDIKEDGLGSINISNWNTQILTNMTSRGSEYGITSQIIETSFNSNTLTNISSMNVNKAVTSRTFLQIANRLEATSASTITCLIDGNSSSPIYRRRVLSSTDVASTGTSFIDIKTGTRKYHINCSNTNGATISSNATFIAFDLTDLDDNVINANTSSNLNSGITGSTVILGAGSHTITSLLNFPIRDSGGDELQVTSTVHLNSTSGVQTPIITLNSSNGCSDEHARSLIADDVGTIKFYSSCNITRATSINLTLGITVAAGEGVIIIDESLTAFEVKSLNISIQNTQPFVNIIAPVPDATIFDDINIEWMTIELNGNDYITNITIVNSSDTNLIFSGLSSSINNITFNFSTLGEGDFTLNITAAENETAERLTGSDSIQITVQFPKISVNLSSPANNSVDIDGIITFQFFTDTGASNNCSLHIDNVINIVNQSINATVGLNTFENVIIANGTHDWLVRCGNSTHITASNQFFFDVTIPDVNALSLTVCPNTTAGMFKLSLIIIIALAFITMGFAFKVGIVGVFGAIMLMISSWFISPCSNVFGTAVALLSGVLLILFILRGFLAGKEEN